MSAPDNVHSNVVSIDLEGGKYTLVCVDGFKLHILRHGEEWVGSDMIPLSKFMLCVHQKLVEQREELERLTKAAIPYKDSTPNLHVGDSSFESWFGGYGPAGAGCKQRALISSTDTPGAVTPYKVDRLFTFEGCTVYRFHADGYPRYFTNCPGSTQWQGVHEKTTQPDGVVGGKP